MNEKPPRHKKQRDPADRVGLVLTVAQAKSYCECCWAGACLVLVLCHRLDEGVVRDEARQIAMELLRLANGFGRRVEGK